MIVDAIAKKAEEKGASLAADVVEPKQETTSEEVSVSE